MKQNTKLIIGGLVVLVVLLVLFLWPQLNNPKNKVSTNDWKSLGVECLEDHYNVERHFHPVLTINVDGKKEAIPSDVGINFNCMSELHTHDATGKIHVEGVKVDRVFTLGTFFGVWGKTIEREGYNLEMTVNKQPNQELGNLVLQPNQVIVLNYTSKLATDN